jgi:hypothetical protein
MHRGERARYRVAPAAWKRYTPGDLSAVYRALNATERMAVDKDVDHLFALKTGVKRKIDPANPRDKPYVRQWLLIRDTVVAIRRFNELQAQEAERRNLEADLQAKLYREKLKPEVSGAAPKLELKGELLGTVLFASHQFVEAVEWSEIFIEVWPHFLEAAAELLEAAGPWVSIVGLPLGVIANLHEITEAHELGEAKARRNAFMHGWASQMVHGRIINALPENFEIGEYQRLGQKAANLFLAKMSVPAREAFLKRYRGQQSYPGRNMDRALRDMGYFGSAE